MNAAIASEYAALVAEARALKDRADAARWRAGQLHDAVLQAMLDDLVSSVRTPDGLLLIDKSAHAAYRDGDRERAVDTVHEHIPELRSVDHRQADYLMRRILAQKGGEWFDEPSDAFSRAFQPDWATKLILRQIRKDK